MSDYYELHEDTLKIFNGVIANADLDRYVSIALRADVKAKEIYSIQKPNKLYKSETKKDIFIIINETIFEQLEEIQQILIAEEIITAIVFDTEKDTLTLKNGDLGITKRGAFTGILKKYSPEMYESVQESIKTLYDVEKETAEV